MQDRQNTPCALRLSGGLLQALRGEELRYVVVQLKNLKRKTLTPQNLMPEPTNKKIQTQNPNFLH